MGSPGVQVCGKMNKSRIVEINGVGTVLFERSKRASHVVIYVRPLSGVRVSVPGRQSFKNAEEFVHVKIPWIQKQLKRIERYQTVNNSISDSFTSFDRAEAKTKLINRLEFLSTQHGFTYNGVYIRNQKTRWGSCSQQDNISLNIMLTRIPAELMDYVILHELVHTRYKNHSQDFWAELDRFVPNSRKISTRLRKHVIESIR